MKKLLLILLSILLIFGSVSSVFATETDDYVSSDSGWVDNGDGTWTYTFDVFDDTQDYYFWEDDMDGYENDIPILDGSRKIENRTGTITNISTKLGSLEVKKTVDWITDADAEHTFDFVITLEGTGIEGAQIFSDVVFNNGVGKIKLKDGESKTIEGLPAGITYKVEEAEEVMFDTESNNAEGEIQAGTLEKVVFNNTEKDLTEVRPGGNIALRKEVVGSETNDTYKIYAVFSDLDVNTKYKTNDESIILESDNIGNGNIEIDIAPNQEIVFYNLPVGAKYQFTEAGGEYISSYKIVNANDGSNETIKTSQSSFANTKPDVQLSTAEETLDNGEEAVVVFTNTYTVKQNLKIKKSVLGTDADKENSYEFEISFFNMEPGSYFNSDIGRIVADEVGEATKGFILTDGQEIVFEEIPVGVQYQITEGKNNCYASYEITDENGGTNIVKASDMNDTTNKSLSTEMETVNEGEEAVVTFTNESEVKVIVKKLVDGNMGDKTESFSFKAVVNGEEEEFELSHDETKEFLMKYGSEFSIKEEDYSEDSYKTYINDSFLQMREKTESIEDDTEYVFKNVRGIAVPTGLVRVISLTAGIIIVSAAIIGFVSIKSKKKNVKNTDCS